MKNKLLVIIFVSVLFAGTLFPVFTDSISGPADTKAYYYDGTYGLLNPSDGKLWEMTVTNIDISSLTQGGWSKAFQFMVQDYGSGSGWEFVYIQVHKDFYGPGGHLFQSG